MFKKIRWIKFAIILNLFCAGFVLFIRGYVQLRFPKIGIHIIDYVLFPALLFLILHSLFINWIIRNKYPQDQVMPGLEVMNYFLFIISVACCLSLIIDVFAYLSIIPSNRNRDIVRLFRYASYCLLLMMPINLYLPISSVTLINVINKNYQMALKRSIHHLTKTN
jgi:hypothetical protein